MRWFASLCRLGLIVLCATAWTFAADPARRVVVVYNLNEPASKPLALYYAEQRGIPAENLCALRVRNAETITRREYEADVRAPLLQFLVDRGLLLPLAQGERMTTLDNKIDCLALMYGVPLRIDADPTLQEKIPDRIPAPARRNEASLDSELTLLPSPGAPLTAWLPNPFFNARLPRFGAPVNNAMLLVARLDGPTPEIARRLIDDALAAERYGLVGRCYFDSRDAKDSAYGVGDTWIREAHKLFVAAGFESELEDTAALLPDHHPVSDVAIYAGWYSGEVVGPFKRVDFQFRPGAFAYHLHSSSAVSVRTKTSYWVGPLLSKGAGASAGHVFEPYLSMTPRLDLFFQRLLAGATFVEAGWFSQPGLSWQTTFVGDPLYRPFALSLDEQLLRLEKEQRPEREWAYLRQINRLLLGGETNEAVRLCQTKASELRSAVLAEKLGDLLLATERVAAYQTALDQAGDTYRYYRIALKLADTYQSRRQPALALAVYEGLLTTHSRGTGAQLLLRRARDAAASAGAADKAKAFQSRLDELVAAEASKPK